MNEYTIKKRLVAIGKDYDVLDSAEKLVYRVDGKVRFGATFEIQDAEGNTLLVAKEKLMAIDRTMLIEKEGQLFATLKRTTVDPPHKFTIEINGAAPIEAKGTFRENSDFRIHQDGMCIAIAYRKPYQLVGETYHLNANSGADVPLLLAITLSLVEHAPYHGESRQ
jgi:uncharacterized protein YxjI